MDKLGNVFEELLVARAVYDEICVQGHGLIGDAKVLGANWSHVHACHIDHTKHRDHIVNDFNATGH